MENPERRRLGRKEMKNDMGEERKSEGRREEE